jgi:hypothetical protein
VKDIRSTSTALKKIFGLKLLIGLAMNKIHISLD